MSKTSLLLFLCTIYFTGIGPGVQAEGGCSPERCGNLTVSYPFGIVSGADANRCAQLGFQVHCAGGTLYLGYYEFVGLQILAIFYANASLLVSDVHKLGDFSAAGCRVPTPNVNTASKIAAPFFISGLNRNLFFYDCSEAPARVVREHEGLVGTVCRDNTFVRAGGRYGDESGDYAIEGCNDTVVTVRGPSFGEVNASDYRELISDGFLLTWQPTSSGVQAEGVCSPERCGNLTVSYRFGIVSGADKNWCAQLGFQVHCGGDTPYLGYYEFDFGLQILDIFYANASLLVSDVHKLGDYSCHIPVTNIASKIAAPFSISLLNQNLIFYNCTKAPAQAVRERAGLVETICRNNTFVPVGGRSDEPRDYAIEGCNDMAVTVQGPPYVKVNASDYRELISTGFLLTCMAAATCRCLWH